MTINNVLRGKTLLLKTIFFAFTLLVCFSFCRSASAVSINQDSLLKVIQQQDIITKVKSLCILAKSGNVNNTHKNEFIFREINALPEEDDADEAILLALDEIGHYFFSCNLTRYSLAATHKCYNLALLTSNVNYQISSAILLSQNYFFLHRIEQSNHYLEKAANLADQNDLDKYKASILNTKANNASELGYNLEALYLYQQTADVLKMDKNYSDLGVVYDNIGLLHIALDNHQKAIPVFHEAISLLKKYGTKQTLVNTYINIGVCFLESDSMFQADRYFQKAISLSKKLKNEFQLARVLMNLANLKMHQKDYAAAKANLDSSLYLCTKNDILPGIVFNKINMGELYLRMGNPQKSLQSLKEAVQSASGLNIADQMAECYRLMSLTSEKLHKPDEALTYYKRFTTLKDSASRAENALHMREMENRINMEKSLKEFNTLKENILKARANNQFLIISFLSLLMASGALVSYLYLRRKKALFKTRLAEEESERLRLHVDHKNKELATKAIHISQMNEMSIELSDKLKSLIPGLNREKAVTVQQIIRELTKSTSREAWKEFEMRFEQVHIDFTKKLQLQYPSLTPNELKICSFLRLNLSSKEISMLTNRSLGTIDNARSSIRTKLQLENEVNLTTFLLGI